VPPFAVTGGSDRQTAEGTVASGASTLERFLRLGSILRFPKVQPGTADPVPQSRQMEGALSLRVHVKHPAIEIEYADPFGDVLQDQPVKGFSAPQFVERPPRAARLVRIRGKGDGGVSVLNLFVSIRIAHRRTLPHPSLDADHWRNLACLG